MKKLLYVIITALNHQNQFFRFLWCLLLPCFISFHAGAQVPRQTQLWVAKKEFFRSNNWDSPYPVTQKLIERYVEDQPRLEDFATGNHSIRTVTDSDSNNRYGLTDYTEWWKWVPHTAGKTGVSMGQDVSKQSTRERPTVDDSWIKANAQIKSYSYSETVVIDTRISLRHTSVYGAEKRGIRFSIQANYYQWLPGFGWVPGGSIPASKITVLGQTLDCNGQVIIKLGAGDFDVTPVVNGDYQYYAFTMTAAPARDHHRTWSYHPYLAFGGSVPYKPVDRFNLFYLTENDGCICDSDPRLDTSTGLSNLIDFDSVPVAAELFVYDATKIVFPKPFDSISNPDYCNIVNVEDADALLAAPFADIKMVQSMYWNGKWKDGRAQLPGNNIIITKNAPINVLMHELGHNLGLDHRNSSTANLMHERSPSTAWEVNRAERVVFER